MSASYTNVSGFLLTSAIKDFEVLYHKELNRLYSPIRARHVTFDVTTFDIEDWANDTLIRRHAAYDCPSEAKSNCNCMRLVLPVQTDNVKQQATQLCQNGDEPDSQRRTNYRFQ